MIESWLLSDEKAYNAIFCKKPTNPELPKMPEDIWGNKNDPTGNHPKQYIKRVLNQFNEISKSELFTKIAENSNIDILKKQCPLSFGRFYNDMQKFL